MSNPADEVIAPARPRVVLGVGGGIAAYKACELLRRFTESGHDVQVVPTAAALRFVGAPTWEALSGHPVSAAVALANLDVLESEDLPGNVRANEAGFRSTLEKLRDLPIVGDVRGAGYFYGIELVTDKDTRQTFDDEESERLLRGFLSHALFDAGLICRADDRGDSVVQVAPPLICDQSHFDEIEQALRSVLTEAWSKL